MHGCHPALALLLVCSLLLASSADFQEGEYVPIARRGQFHGLRTNWHDLLGRHCPRFAQNSQVALPIPQPAGYNAATRDYKLQLSLDGDRIFTPWLKLIGKRAPVPPYLHVEIAHSGPAIIGVKAKVDVAPRHYYSFDTLEAEFRNGSHWPKHLLVQYTWRHTDPINVTGGLYFVFGIGTLATVVLAASVILSYQKRLQAFLADLTSEEGAPFVAPPPVEKAE